MQRGPNGLKFREKNKKSETFNGWFKDCVQKHETQNMMSIFIIRSKLFGKTEIQT